MPRASLLQIVGDILCTSCNDCSMLATGWMGAGLWCCWVWDARASPAGHSAIQWATGMCLVHSGGAEALVPCKLLILTCASGRRERRERRAIQRVFCHQGCVRVYSDIHSSWSSKRCSKRGKVGTMLLHCWIVFCLARMCAGVWSLFFPKQKKTQNPLPVWKLSEKCTWMNRWSLMPSWCSDGLMVRENWRELGTWKVASMQPDGIPFWLSSLVAAEALGQLLPLACLHAALTA